MTLNERIAYAEGRRDHAIENEDADFEISFWRGYIHGLKSHRNDLERDERRRENNDGNNS